MRCGHGVEHMLLEALSRFNKHDSFICRFYCALPSIHGRHARQNVDACGETRFDQLAAHLEGVAFAGKRAINQNRSIGFIHGFLFHSPNRRNAVLSVQPYGPGMTKAEPENHARGSRVLDKVRLGFVASPAPEAQAALGQLLALYPNVDPEQATVIVALGGDGLMLQTLHRFMGTDVPIYGMHRGSVGFLMNEFAEGDLFERVANAKLSVIHPLKMQAENTAGETLNALAINEVHLFRQTAQSARLSVFVDGKERLSELICDGILVATPAGSTAYNLSVGGPILPLRARLLALTPISPFRPRRWRGALLPNKAQVRIDVLEAAKRPMSAVADHTEFRDVTTVLVKEERNIDLKLLFDPGHALEERIVAEQFHF